jgi:hypothetical protein
MYLLLCAALLAFSPVADTAAREAYEAFTDFFESAGTAAPEGVRVLGVKLEGDHLTVNISDDIMNYGGNENERELIRQLLETAASLPDTVYFTLLIESRLIPLPEGREVERMSINYNDCWGFFLNSST